MKLEAKTEKEMCVVEAAWPKTEEQLIEYIRSCLAAVNAPADMNNEDTGDACGRAVYAISLASVATFNYIAHVEGITGFQASCADLDIIRRTRRINGPFGIYSMRDMLYPQYDLVARLTEFINSENTQKWLKEEATKLLAEKQEHASPSVVAHWKKLAGVE